jgi:hypothetical protein
MFLLGSTTRDLDAIPGFRPVVVRTAHAHAFVRAGAAVRTVALDESIVQRKQPNAL